MLVKKKYSIHEHEECLKKCTDLATPEDDRIRFKESLFAQSHSLLYRILILVRAYRVKP